MASGYSFKLLRVFAREKGGAGRRSGSKARMFFVPPFPGARQVFFGPRKQKYTAFNASVILLKKCCLCGSMTLPLTQ